MHTRRFVPIAALTAIALTLSPLADAGRLGGGKSAGMTRSAPSSSVSRPAPATTQPAPVSPAAAPTTSPAPAAKGPGWGGVAAGAAAGVAAGAAIGYLASQPSGQQPAAAASTAPSTAAAANNPLAAESAPKSGSSGSSMLLLLLLAGAGLLLFVVYRRSQANRRPTPTTYTAMPSPGNAAKPLAFDAPGYDAPQSGGALPMASASSVQNGRLPDGTELPAFLRQAKASFLHMQTMNSPDHVEELRAYMTPELFDALRADIAANATPADFTTLNADVIDAVLEGSNYVATVRFSGQVSEDVNKPPLPFAELWHFTKPNDGKTAKWLVAGIQQES